MNLYLIEAPKDYGGWDTYDSAVVVAMDSDAARMIHPNGEKWNGKCTSSYSWCPEEDVIVTYIGVTDTFKEGSVICASYNAG
jgi:hypothetical protein